MLLGLWWLPTSLADLHAGFSLEEIKAHELLFLANEHHNLPSYALLLLLQIVLDMNSMPISRLLLSCHHLRWSAKSFVTQSLSICCVKALSKWVRNLDQRAVILCLARATTATADAIKPCSMWAVWAVIILFRQNFNASKMILALFQWKNPIRHL